MYQDFYQYLQSLKGTIQSHEKRIAILEQTIQKMQKEIKELNEKKTIHVDRIEYKFDQLKVETLDGTLNIGLNPNDLSAIEEFEVQNQTNSPPNSPKMQMQRSLFIEEAIYRYLDTDLPRIMEESQKKLGMEPNDSYFEFVKQDIIKQLPNRIDFHLKMKQEKERSNEGIQITDEHIIETLKQEIQNGVISFLKNLPEYLKGRNP
ncbi:spore germination protein GerPC [Neobacillus sedimentimangrovi]|jgi:spore germination protein PC|uniref:spore germination protein GerPC n=1 Tax=Neobacillus sedimentimangrovi TaxID=2699460 RepID=UPI0013D75E47|nr:spore germination protein GerPC [Neobacillus sedimentimangrovi]